jgi:hypothetical protein
MYYHVTLRKIDKLYSNFKYRRTIQNCIEIMSSYSAEEIGELTKKERCYDFSDRQSFCSLCERNEAELPSTKLFSNIFWHISFKEGK